MSQQQSQQAAWDELRTTGPYSQRAYLFVQEGLSHTVKQIYGDPSEAQPGETHVSGQQLCEGLANLAMQKYGLLARDVLRHWNVHRTVDFGKIVFKMIDLGWMTRTDEDDIHDFKNVYDFDQAFARDRILDFLRNN